MCCKKQGRVGCKNIPADVFVSVYNQCETRSEVLAKFEALGFRLQYGSLISRAKAYKEAGCNLKQLKRKKVCNNGRPNLKQILAKVPGCNPCGKTKAAKSQPIKQTQPPAPASFGVPESLTRLIISQNGQIKRVIELIRDYQPGTITQVINTVGKEAALKILEKLK